MSQPHIVLLALIALSFVISGFVEGKLVNSEAALSAFAYQWAEAIHLVLVVILSFLWCRTHASSRGISAPAFSPLLVALVPLIGIPYYFFKSMPRSSAFRSCGLALLYVAACIGLYLVGDVVSGGGGA